MLTAAARRRIFGDYQATEPSRFLDEIPAHLVDRTDLSASGRPLPAYALRNPYGRRGPARVREERPSYAYEHEDQSPLGLRTGMRVRHQQFGVGTVVDIEEQADDLKLTVRFNSAGTKKLLARYARLEPA
jgi:DNA helicase-2/ATP-dependent DNA helicase PcrA